MTPKALQFSDQYYSQLIDIFLATMSLFPMMLSFMLRSRPQTPESSANPRQRYGEDYPGRRYSATPSHSVVFLEDSQPMYACSRGGKPLQLLINLTLLTASLVLIGTGAGLMGFYRIHMLEVVTIEFLIVPLVLVVGGIYTLITALFGFYATFR